MQQNSENTRPPHFFSRGFIRCGIALPAALVIITVTACGGGESGGPTPDPNPATPRQDSASSVIGAGGGLVITPNGDAGVQIPAGVLAQNATITVTKLPAPATPGQGPLPTALKQYGPFYEIQISPANAQLGDSVRVGLCQVTDPSSPFYPPEPHNQLRLAHTVAGATEILAPVGVTDFLNCSGVSASTDVAAGESRLERTFASVMNHTLGFLAPRSLYAAHGGLGGKVKSFSPFGAVDPLTGLSIGPESTLSFTTRADDLGSAAFDGTNYLVTFNIRDAQNISQPRAQIVAPNGALFGSQIVLANPGGIPVVAFDGNNYLLVWNTGATNGSLIGQFVNKLGALVGGQFVIATGSFPEPTALVFGGGTYLLNYTRQINPVDYGYRQFIRMISPAGVVGGQVQITASLVNSGFNCAAFDGTNFFVVYTDGSFVKGRFVSTSGALGAEPTIFPASLSPLVSVGFNGTNFLVAGSSNGTSADGFGQLVDRTGANVGSRITIADGGADEIVVAVTPSGTNFIVSYIDSLTSLGSPAIKGKVVSATGSTNLPPLRIAGPVDGKVTAGFIVNFDGTRYFGLMLRGLQLPGNEPGDVDLWGQKDVYSFRFTYTIPP